MTNGDHYLQNTRELLQYVPQFTGKTFVIELPWRFYTDSQKAEVMLDVVALQSIGVRLALAVCRSVAKDIVDWAIDFDLRLENDLQQDSVSAVEVMDRGQIVMVPSENELSLSSNLISVVEGLAADKVICLLAGELRTSLGSGVSLSVDDWRRGSYREWLVHEPVLQLLAGGVDRVHLLDGMAPGVILAELFSNEGCGLMIYQDSYRKIRNIRSEDIPEVLTMIGRSVRQSNLVPREYEDIERQMADYYVYQIDENVVGCVALHRYGESWGEVACLYVKQGHQGRGYGEELVNHVENLAKATGVTKFFALTTGASMFFKDRLGFKELPLDTIPAERLEVLRSSGRESLAFLRKL